MGDYYYAGLGSDEPLLEKAAACYQSAAGSHISAMAMWNLGWMHETGKGVAQVRHFPNLFRYRLFLIQHFDGLGLSSRKTILRFGIGDIG